MPAICSSSDQPAQLGGQQRRPEEKTIHQKGGGQGGGGHPGGRVTSLEPPSEQTDPAAGEDEGQEGSGMEQGAGGLLEKHGGGFRGGLHHGGPQGHQAREGDQSVGEGGAQQGSEIERGPDPPARPKPPDGQRQGKGFDRQVESGMLAAPSPEQGPPQPTPRKPNQKHAKPLAIRVGMAGPAQGQQEQRGRAEGGGHGEQTHQGGLHEHGPQGEKGRHRGEDPSGRDPEGR
jgi:hypothetical protein